MACRLQSTGPMLTCTEHSVMVSITVIIISIILWLCPEPGESLKCSQTCRVSAG